MAYFPFFVEIENAQGLIVGGGKHALGKVEKLIPYGPKLRVIAPVVSEKIREYETLEIVERKFVESDLDPLPDFVIIACDDLDERKWIAGLCQEKRILVNSVDDIENCGFVFPALVRRGKLSVGVMTGGASPAVGMDIKKHLEEWLPDNIEEILDYMEKIRPEMKEKYPDEKERGKAFREMYKNMSKNT